MLGRPPQPLLPSCCHFDANAQLNGLKNNPKQSIVFIKKCYFPSVTENLLHSRLLFLNAPIFLRCSITSEAKWTAVTCNSYWFSVSIDILLKKMLTLFNNHVSPYNTNSFFVFPSLCCSNTWGEITKMWHKQTTGQTVQTFHFFFFLNLSFQCLYAIQCLYPCLLGQDEASCRVQWNPEDCFVFLFLPAQSSMCLFFKIQNK